MTTVMPSTYDDRFYDERQEQQPPYGRRRKRLDFYDVDDIDVDGPGRCNNRSTFLGYGHASAELNRNFEDALIDPSYAVSPMKSMRFFLDLGTLVGVFPAKRGTKHIFFGFECCSLQTVWSIFFTVFWLLWGAVLAFYCATNDNSITRTNHTGISSILEVKTVNQTYYLSSTDQFVVVGTPFILVLAWFVSLILGWTRINYLTDLCYHFCKRGFRIDSRDQ